MDYTSQLRPARGQVLSSLGGGCTGQYAWRYTKDSGPRPLLNISLYFEEMNQSQGSFLDTY